MARMRQEGALYITDGFRGFESVPGELRRRITESVSSEAHDFRNVGAYCSDGEPLTGELKKFAEDKKSKGEF